MLFFSHKEKEKLHINASKNRAMTASEKECLANPKCVRLVKIFLSTLSSCPFKMLSFLHFCVRFCYWYFSWHDISGAMTMVWKKTGGVVANPPKKVVNPR